MRETYDIKPFEIETISLERIFIDKVFAAQFYYERKEYSDVAKHVYDLTVLLDNEQIKNIPKR
ncbi:MAG: nucleotidyl transferase AbiEii/AbiGii toxin family protein [Clostridiales bacterium]|nr:MAG: nucleotidyl transferase AbiEii/AbiGii toxin family protein [Clostridiales bacterium]